MVQRHGVTGDQVRQLAQQVQQQYRGENRPTPEQIATIEKQWRDNRDTQMRDNPQQNPYRANPPLTPDKVEDLRKQYEQNPQAFIDNLRRQQLEQLGILPGGPHDRGAQGQQPWDKGTAPNQSRTTGAARHGQRSAPRRQDAAADRHQYRARESGPINPAEIDPRLARTSHRSSNLQCSTRHCRTSCATGTTAMLWQTC